MSNSCKNYRLTKEDASVLFNSIDLIETAGESEKVFVYGNVNNVDLAHSLGVMKNDKGYCLECEAIDKESLEDIIIDFELNNIYDLGFNDGSLSVRIQNGERMKYSDLLNIMNSDERIGTGAFINKAETVFKYFC